ncbi:LacI family transcriptional regulator [Mucilaginibacter sp. RS28]|uniref:LacI family transcriptional regulator n=1 Tax=Mucilaginibacter straminoryzae TaxID=2932774 RepID=A0A9X1X618_9SPHI|nr:LacI family DNA-binding transcriptional regulator [Mucilaginibacter straminoryzae]MCJ8211631.1 LacI family transcriptional regulator [Mucilaginibacter straminoryzae]
MNKKTSLKDIAAHLGVSVALVSYVLNNKAEQARVGKEMAERIKQAAKDLNYQPNLIAKGLKSGRTKTIGLIVADISNPFFANIARVIEDEASKNGYTVIFGSSDEDAQKSMALTETLINRQVDGLIIAPAEHTQEQIENLQNRNIPIVLIDRYFPTLDTSAVYINNFGAAKSAVTHLIENGYSNVGMVTYQNQLFHVSERVRGYKAALEQRGIGFKEEWLIRANYHGAQNELEKHLKNILTGDDAVDALFFSNNSLAVACLKIIHQLGINVPDELGLVSFDGSEAFDFFYAPLTYVKQDISRIGAAAVQLLLKQFTPAHEPEKIEIPATLIVQKSSIRRR